MGCLRSATPCVWPNAETFRWSRAISGSCARWPVRLQALPVRGLGCTVGMSKDRAVRTCREEGSLFL